MKAIKLQPFLLALTLVNLAMFAWMLAQPLAQAAPNDDGILRGKGLQIVDDNGKVRASITIFPESRQPDGSMYAENVLLRLITAEGRPSVKIQAGEDRTGMALSDAEGLAYAQVLVQGDEPKVVLVDKTGQPKP